MSELLKSVPAKANGFVFGVAHIYDDGSVFVEVNEDLSDEEKEVIQNLLGDQGCRYSQQGRH